ncbi:hypothetical protein DO97_00520 [Neosynechococcus sphagnicola sy1]|uniref:SWIM-type domain-containing protein n=1 Tax=Neosynechococcus sphagnicola sy1 TaxID=1497020 RepID=A0A098TNX2_9CYAN|nr:SWIM zinc finger family protein [Neosynechococcus sphagnicola]KGF74035.1 hypothetical protein DO97_00520 [Neosynechococcus sphagnicola sy1]
MNHYDQSTNPEWWVQAWLDLLARYRFKKRLERARDYARQGNVLGIEFQGAKVLATVRGREHPEYQVSLWLDTFTNEQWNYVIETMGQEAIFSAKLLAGEMPQNIEAVFAANGLSLFPFSLTEIHSKCSCPDQANPCKHIGAVYYLLGDRFSEDPFVLFQLRGRTKDQIIEALRQLRSLANPESPAIAASPTPAVAPPWHLADFWRYDQQLESSLVVIAPPPTPETVLDVLGSIPLKPEITGNAVPIPIATQTVMEQLRKIYQAVSQRAVQLAMTKES